MKGRKMSEKCFSCKKKFGWLREKHSCKLCGEKFCNDCISQATLSNGIYGNKLMTTIGEPRFELILKDKNISYRIMNQQDFTKSCLLCKICKSKITKKIKEFREEITNRLDSILVTTEGNFPGYRIIKNLGIISCCQPDVLFDPGKGIKLAMPFLKYEVMKRGGNALINFQQTFIKKANLPAPQKPITSWEDFIPGYREQIYQKYQKQTPHYFKIPKYQAQAVVIQKIKD